MATFVLSIAVAAASTTSQVHFASTQQRNALSLRTAHSPGSGGDCGGTGRAVLGLIWCNFRGHRRPIEGDQLVGSEPEHGLLHLASAGNLQLRLHQVSQGGAAAPAADWGSHLISSTASALTASQGRGGACGWVDQGDN